jgi:hypothetical protein
MPLIVLDRCQQSKLSDAYIDILHHRLTFPSAVNSYPLVRIRRPYSRR